jgi:hypothetical protein
VNVDFVDGTAVLHRSLCISRPHEVFADDSHFRPAARRVVQHDFERNGQDRMWAYLVPFPVVNSSTIEKLIDCKSQGVNVSRPDSNGRISDGILQFNRGPSNKIGSGTWAEMAKRFGLGSPINPPDAIKLADAMILGGFLGRWTRAHLARLL